MNGPGSYPPLLENPKLLNSSRDISPRRLAPMGHTRKMRCVGWLESDWMASPSCSFVGEAASPALLHQNLLTCCQVHSPRFFPTQCQLSISIFWGRIRSTQKLSAL